MFWIIVPFFYLPDDLQQTLKRRRTDPARIPHELPRALCAPTHPVFYPFFIISKTLCCHAWNIDTLATFHYDPSIIVFSLIVPSFLMLKGYCIVKIALIANPNSGGKKANQSILQIKEKLKTQKIDSDLFLTQYHTHACEIVKEIKIREYDAVVSMGGDGTNYEVLNGVLKYHGDGDIPPLGIIPLGRGNSFARDLQIITADDGVSALFQSTLKAVDVCSFTQNSEKHYFINLMGLGFVTDAAKTAYRFNWMGDFSYILGVLHRTVQLAFHKIVLDIDGTVIIEKNCFVEFCNSRYTGGDMLIAPDAKIDDGFFDVVILSPLSRISLIATFPKIFKGTHGINPAVRFIKGKSAQIYTEPVKGLLPDGEMFGTTPTEIKIHPGLVRYFS